MRSKRKALQETRKSGLVNQEVTSSIALEQLQDGINQDDFARLENEGGSEDLISGEIAKDVQLHPVEAAPQTV